MKSILITGGAHGIGAATTRMAARQGWRTGILDRDAAAATALAAELPDAVALACDVTDEAAVEAALDSFGTPAALANNAGVVTFAPLFDTPLDTFRRVLEIDLAGAFVVARATGRRMADAGGGAIVNVTSTGGICTSPGTNAYAAAKAGLAALTELMALEWGPLGIRVNAVAPGMTDGGVSAPIYAIPGARERRAQAVPLRRLADTDDIAAAILWLVSDGATYVHGHQLVVDGGLTRAVMTLVPRPVPDSPPPS